MWGSVNTSHRLFALTASPSSMPSPEPAAEPEDDTFPDDGWTDDTDFEPSDRDSNDEGDGGYSQMNILAAPSCILNVSYWLRSLKRACAS